MPNWLGDMERGPLPAWWPSDFMRQEALDFAS